jgi:hypothetical protein
VPELPEPLRGGSFISVRGCYCGEPVEAGEELLRPWREFGEPLVDTFGVMPYREMDMISMDPPIPWGSTLTSRCFTSSPRRPSTSWWCWPA